MEAHSDIGNSFALPSEVPEQEHTLKFKVVGRLVNTKKFNFKALQSVLLVAWKLAGEVQIENLQDGSFVCSFSNLADRE